MISCYYQKYAERTNIGLEQQNYIYWAGTTELHILRTNNKYIFNEYVFWFIKTDAFIKERINNFTGAVGQQRIGKEFIAETLIPIPPLNEQRKICNSIHELMKKLDEIILNL